MLNGLSVFAENGEALHFTMPEAGNGYLIEEIEGLDPVPVSISSAAYGILAGSYYQSSRREERNIVLHIKLQKSWAETTVQERRQHLYKWFVPQQELRFQFTHSVIGTVIINGRVESIESPIFTKNPTVVVSILCNDPDFRSVSRNEHVFMVNVPYTIDYAGTIGTGFLIEATKWDVGAFSVIFSNRPGGGQTQNLIFPGTFYNNERLVVSTEDRNRYARYRTAEGVLKSALSRKTSDSVWLRLMPGVNTFTASASNSTAKNILVSYYNVYGGL